jgi:hypothetical protein
MRCGCDAPKRRDHENREVQVRAIEVVVTGLEKPGIHVEEIFVIGLGMGSPDRKRGEGRIMDIYPRQEVKDSIQPALVAGLNRANEKRVTTSGRKSFVAVQLSCLLRL